MKNLHTLVLVLIVFFAAVFYSGCSDSSTTETVGKNAFFGVVSDLSGFAIPDVIVSTSPATMIDTTDNLGRFSLTQIKTGTYYIIFEKPGTNFRKDSIQKVVGTTDSLQVNFSMLQRSDVLIYRDIVVDDWKGLTSVSGIDCWLGKSVQENPLTYDMQLRDSSLFTPDSNLYIRSGHIALKKMPAGYRTYFSGVIGTYSETDWNNLNYIPTFTPNQTITYTNAISYFLEDQIPYFNYPLPALRPVYGFWLEGRYSPTFNDGKYIYGMIYIKNITVGSAGYKVIVDLKLNLQEKNSFIQN